jgi:Sulfotransferase domain
MKQNVFLAGVAKCGTSTLNDMLCQHPRIGNFRSPNGNRIKEPRCFFFTDDIEDFNSHFDQSKDIFLDSSIGYLPNRKALQRIQKAVPDAKIIISLRNPVARFFSHYFFGKSRIDTENESSFHRQSSYSIDEIFHRYMIQKIYKSDGIIERGFYFEQLDYLFTLFPRDNIKIIIYERFIKNPVGCVNKLFDFIGVESCETIPVHELKTSVKKVIVARQVQILKELYEEDVVKLRMLLNDKIPEWKI